MAVHVCPECGTEHSSKKKKRACMFGHLADEEQVETSTEPTEGELLTEEVELEPDEELEDAVNEEAESQEDEEEPEREYFVKQPVVIQAYKTDKERKIETLAGTMIVNPGDWVITGVAGEQYPCKPEIFEKTYTRCDGEIVPTILPKHLIPEELQYLATGQPVSIRVQGVLTKNYEVEVKEVEFIRR